ncbi:MAG: 5'-nucleotidase C-terminal domain-containing protein [Armatimonadetes bacterium]|nr:5'-nucleotidase C-terminal domain-containing protein [Armatimonadota bacterium]
MNKSVGETLVDLVRDRRGESNIGDLIADAMREHAGADIAFHNGGGIRADIYRGPVTAGAIFSALPFENVLTSVDLTGAQVLEVLQHGFSGGHGAVQLSGIRVHKRGGVLEATIGGKPLEEGRVYRVVTNDFMAAGGDGYETFKNGRNTTYGDLLRDVVSRHIHTHSPIRRELDGRIRID